LLIKIYSIYKAKRLKILKSKTKRFRLFAIRVDDGKTAENVWFLLFKIFDLLALYIEYICKSCNKNASTHITAQNHYYTQASD